MTKNQKPMPLEELPGYLDSLQQRGDMSEDSCVVVDMGKIIDGPTWWTRKKIIAIAASLMIMVGIVAYSLQPEQITMVVDLNNTANPTRTISDIVGDDGQVVAVTKLNDSQYEVKVSTRKNRKSFLEWLHRNKNVRVVN